MNNKGHILATDALRLKTLKKYIGLEIKQTCGLTCKCIEYHSSKSIIVEFTDGTTMHATVSQFMHGNVKPDSKQIHWMLFRHKRIGRVVRQSFGLIAECIDCLDKESCIVQFNNGVQLKCSWSQFVRGKLSAYEYLCHMHNVGLNFNFIPPAVQNDANLVKCVGVVSKKCYIFSLENDAIVLGSLQDFLWGELNVSNIIKPVYYVDSEPYYILGYADVCSSINIIG